MDAELMRMEAEQADALREEMRRATEAAMEAVRKALEQAGGGE